MSEYKTIIWKYKIRKLHRSFFWVLVGENCIGLSEHNIWDEYLVFDGDEEVFCSIMIDIFEKKTSTIYTRVNYMQN